MVFSLCAWGLLNPVFTVNSLALEPGKCTHLISWLTEEQKTPLCPSWVLLSFIMLALYPDSIGRDATFYQPAGGH
jgi:hypothetical protein